MSHPFRGPRRAGHQRFSDDRELAEGFEGLGLGGRRHEGHGAGQDGEFRGGSRHGRQGGGPRPGGQYGGHGPGHRATNDAESHGAHYAEGHGTHRTESHGAHHEGSRPGEIFGRHGRGSPFPGPNSSGPPFGGPRSGQHHAGRRGESLLQGWILADLHLEDHILVKITEDVVQEHFLQGRVLADLCLENLLVNTTEDVVQDHLLIDPILANAMQQMVEYIAKPH